MTRGSATKTCPVCNGRGFLPEPRQASRNRSDERKQMARTLRKAGYSLRQIQDFLGWKSVRSVATAIEDK